MSDVTVKAVEQDIKDVLLHDGGNAVPRKAVLLFAYKYSANGVVDKPGILVHLLKEYGFSADEIKGMVEPKTYGVVERAFK